MTAPDAPAVLGLSGWGWRHAGRDAWALRGVDLSVQAGERVLLLGPSGAGKSTLLAGIAGLLDDTDSGEQEGSCTVDGVPAAQARDRTGLVFQDPQTQLVMARSGDDVAFGLENRGVPAAHIWPRVDEALAAVGFGYGRDRSTAALSGGEQQRLALAGVVALRPGLLLLDEPTANLDPPGAALVRESLRAVLDTTGATMLLVEHRVEAVLDLVDRVVVVLPGQGVVIDGPPDQVFSAHAAELAQLGVWVPGWNAPTARRAKRVGEPVLATAGVCYRYPGATRDAVSEVDSVVRAGEALALTGVNGSGKSTLSLLLAGLIRPTGGVVRAQPALTDDARPPWRWVARDLVTRIGTVFQDPEHQFLTGRVADELAVGPLRAGLGGGAAHDRAADLMDRLHLRHLAEANPFSLSGGEKRRLSVATALATAPAVLVLDEPTFGQDRRTWVELVTLIADLRDQGTAAVLVTHDRELVDAVADREVVLHDGRLSTVDGQSLSTAAGR